MKRINVTGDIESRRRIAERRIPAVRLPQTQKNEETQEKENNEGHGVAEALKARRGKAARNT